MLGAVGIHEPRAVPEIRIPFWGFLEKNSSILMLFGGSYHRSLKLKVIDEAAQTAADEHAVAEGTAVAAASKM